MSSAGFPGPGSPGVALREGTGVHSGPCPTPEQLLGFHLGSLTEEGLEQVGDHLEGCMGCRERVQTFDRVTDPVLAALRSPGAADAATPLPGEPGETATQPPVSLFGPPQGPDEIGRLRHYRVLRLLG